MEDPVWTPNSSDPPEPYTATGVNNQCSNGSGLTTSSAAPSKPGLGASSTETRDQMTQHHARQRALTEMARPEDERRHRDAMALHAAALDRLHVPVEVGLAVPDSGAENTLAIAEWY